MLINGELQIAEYFYDKSRLQEEGKRRISIELAEAYLGLSKVHKQDKTDLAKADILECIRIQNDLHMHKDHLQVKEAREVEKELQTTMERAYSTLVRLANHEEVCFKR